MIGMTQEADKEDLLERFHELIEYVETWPDGGNEDGFADLLREVWVELAGHCEHE